VTLPLSYSRPKQLPKSMKPPAVQESFNRQQAVAASKGQNQDHSAGGSTQFLEPMTRIELVTSPLPRECSTN
jgi:hypothetical protein